MRYFSFPIPEFNDWTAIRRAFQVLKKILEETGHSHVWNEIPPEAVENNADYTTVYKFIPNTLEVFYNGVLIRNGIDYTETTNHQGFSLHTIGRSGSVQCHYVKDLSDL